MSERKVPKIRFPGFTGEWEERKCEEILKPVKGAMKIGPFGSALKKEFYTEAGVKVYAQENIFQEDFTIGDYYITDERYQTLKGCKLEPGDLVISMMGTIGACAIFPEDAETGIMNSHLLRLQLKDDIYSEYIHQLLRDSQIIRDQIDRLSVGSIMNGLSSSVVQKLLFPVPSLAEQKRIAELLIQMDNAITLHQCECNKWKELKKGMLQKMFPKEGESVPEIRFPGFTDPWKQRKYEDIIDLLSGQDFEPSAYNDEEMGIPYMTGASCVIDGKTIVNRWTLTPKCIANKGDVLLVCKGSGYGTLAVLSQERAHIARQFMALKSKPELNNHFNYYLAYSVVDEIKKDARGLIAGIAREAVLNEAIFIPQLEEQQRISEFFVSIDNTISLHQRECDKWQTLKKALLQQMFV